MLWRFFCLLTFACSLSALPSGGEIAHGQVNLFSSSNALEIHAHGKGILHWDQFHIASHETVRFVQLQGNQAILNRVTGGDTSQILGKLLADCPVYLINPEGIFVGNSACIDTAGFLASTADLSNEAFLQDAEILFQGFGNGHIINLGKVSATQGDIFLIARNIVNEGKIEVPDGIAVLTTCEVALHPGTKECIFIRVDETLTEEGIQNSGEIRALSIDFHTRSPYETAIQHTGCIEGLTTIENNGRIYLVAEEGRTFIDGSLVAEAGEIQILGQKVHIEDHASIDVSGSSGGTVLIGGDYQGVNPNILNAKETRVAQGAQIHSDADLHGNGGKVVVWSDQVTSYAGTITACGGSFSGDGGLVEVSGKRLQFNGTVKTDAPFGKVGTLLLDPTNVTISAADSGGSFSGCIAGTNTFTPDAAATDTIAAATLIGLLNAPCNVTISTVGSTGGGTGAITISNAVNWSASTTLTLTAVSNISISAAVTNTSASTGFTAMNFTANGIGAVANPGILLGAAGNLTTTGGDVILNGTSSTAAAASHGVSFNGGTIATGAGNITVTGVAPLGATGASVHGINMNTANGMTSTSGNITLSGITNTSGNTSFGIQVSQSWTTGTTGTLTFQNCAGGTGTACHGVNLGGAYTGSGPVVFSSCTGGNNVVTGGNGINAAAAFTTTDTITATNSIVGQGNNSVGFACSANFSTSGAAKAMAITASSTGTTGACPGISHTAGTISTTSGSLTLQGTGGTGSNGITNTGGTITTSAGGALSMTGNAGAGGTGIGISHTGGTLSTTNNGNLSLTGNGAGTGSGSNGINITTNITVAGTGTLTINGIASAAATGTGISVTAGTVSTVSGLMTLNGTGGGTGSNNTGLLYTGGSIVTTNGGITIQVTGGGDASSSGNIGFVNFVGLSSTSGNISITALGSAAGVSNNWGIFLLNTTAGSGGLVVIQTGGSITIDATGVTTGTGTGNIGVVLDHGGAIQATGTQNLILTAIGDVNGSSNNAIGLSIQGSTGGMATVGLFSGGNLQVTATGSGGTGAGHRGCSMTNIRSLLNTTGNGTLTLLATGGTNSIGDSNVGLYVNGFGVSSNGGGNISITALGSTAGVSNNWGIFLLNTTAGSGGLVVIQTGGSITIDATGVTTGTGTGNIGVVLDHGGAIQATGTQNLILTAIGDVNGSSNNAIGLSIQGSTGGMATVGLFSGGNLQVTATGSGGTGAGHRGCSMTNIRSLLNTTGNGTLTLLATGGTNSIGDSNVGLYVNGFGVSSNGGGNISITALGSTAGVSNNWGIFLLNTTAASGGLVVIQTGGSITIDATGVTTGTGTGNIGVALDHGGRIQTTGMQDLIVTAIGDVNGSSNNAIGLSIQGGTGGNPTMGLISGGNLQVTATGSGGTGAGHRGCSMSNLRSLLNTTGNGTLTLLATGGANSTGNNNIGLSMQFSPNGVGFGISSSGGGNISITALGALMGGGTSNGNIGLTIENASSANRVIISTSGSVLIDAKAVISGTGSNNIGINVGRQATIQSTGNLSTNSVTINALSGNSGGTGNQGMILTSSGIISTVDGNLTITGTGGATAGSSNDGIVVNNASAQIASTSGAISLTGNGGFASNGIHITAGSISTGGSGTITAQGTGGAGTGGYGIFMTGASSLVQSANGLISMTGNGAGTGANAEGIGVFSAARIDATGSGGITLNGTGAAMGGNTSRGIVVTETSSAVTTASGAIIANGTGGNGAAATGNNGLEVSAGGRISSTSGSISGTCLGGAGTSDNNGILVTGLNSQITTATGSGINLTGTGSGTGTSNRGMSLVGTGAVSAIASTSTAPITLTGTGSLAGTFSNEGIFITGATTNITAANAPIQLTGTAGAGTTSGITIDNGGAVLTTPTSGNITANATGRISLLAGASGSAQMATTNGNISATASDLLVLTGSTVLNTFAQMTVGNAANTVTIQSLGIDMDAGTGSGAFAEISSNGGLITINGAGPITLDGNTNTNSYAQIITKTTALTTATPAISIGQSSAPTSITLRGNSGGTLARAVIATDTGGNITCTTSGTYTITGGTSANDSRAGFYTGLNGGSGDITLEGAEYALTGGASGGGYNSAEIMATDAISITSNGSDVTLLAQGADTSDARIITLDGGNIQLNTIGAFSATGGAGALARSAVVTDTGGNITATSSGDYTLTGGSSSGDARAGFYSGLSSGSGDIDLTGTGFSLTGGSSTGYNSAEIMTPATGSGAITLTSGANLIELQGGTGDTSDARIVTAGSGNIGITGTGGFSAVGGSGASSVADVNADGTLTMDIGAGNYILTGGGGDASVARATATGDLDLTGGDYTLTGGASGTADGSNAVIESTGVGGSVTLDGAAITLNGGTAADQHSYIQTTAGAGTNPIDITCTAMLLNGASVSNGSAEITTVLGNIGINSSGDVDLTGGAASGANARIEGIMQGSITLDALNLFVNGGSAAGISGIQTQSGDITVTCAQDCLYTALTAGAPAVLRTFGSDLTVTVGGSIVLLGFGVYSTPAPGHLLLVAGVDIELHPSSLVRAFGNANSSLTMIVDNNFPTPPAIGPGQFIIHPGAIVLTGGLMAELKIYTGTFPQNIVNVLLINLAPWIPGSQFVNSVFQQWGVYYPGGTYGGFPFKFYYKNTGIPPTPPPPPSPSLPSRNIAANLVELAILLPVMQGPRLPFVFPNYHFQVCEQDAHSKICNPTFSPYGSFIFEDDVYWIGVNFWSQED